MKEKQHRARMKELKQNRKQMEENVASGGLSEKVITLVEQEKLPIEVLPITIPDEYVEHGNVDILKQEIGISTSAVLEKIEKELEAK